MAALELGTHSGHVADHSRNLLPQRIDEAIALVAAGTAQTKTLGIEIDVQRLAQVLH